MIVWWIEIILKDFVYIYEKLNVYVKKVFSIYFWFNKCVVMRGFLNKLYKELLWCNVVIGLYKKNNISILSVYFKCILI